MRFAGDFFGVTLTTPEENKRSLLVDYFPDLRSVKKSAVAEEGGSRNYGGSKAVTPFTGFKTMEDPGRAQSAPQFFGFKTFEQPKIKLKRYRSLELSLKVEKVNDDSCKVVWA